MTQKFHTIQYLRAIAAVLVLVSHAMLYRLADNAMTIGRLGWMGVILFFVVSGFIMVTVTGEGRFDAGQFLRRRILRVVPLYWGVTMAAAAMTLLLPSLFKSMVFDGEQVILSLFFVPFYNPTTHGLHPFYKLGWTLNYEMFFYLSFALLALLRAQARVAVLTIAYLALAIIGWLVHPREAIPAFYTSFMPLAFVAGAWLGLAQLKGQLVPAARSAALPLCILAVAGVLEGFAIDRGIIEDQTAFVGLLTFAVAALALVVSFEPRLPQVPVLERLGDASYSIYLMHMFSVAGITGVLLKFAGANDENTIHLAITAAMIGGLCLGWLTYRFIEKPLMRRLRQFA